ncbi:MAG TPA: LysR family transcriptional regulator [Hyalangium sp.]|nr:LysR family transcriptional regulator [Hyalangium sp.]
MSRLFEAEVFVLVVDEGSFTAAARRLAITKSYASKLVTRLEDRLGVRLLQRSTRQLTLTEPGRAYYERCTEVMQTLEQAEDEATSLHAAPRGRLRVTLPTAFGMSYLTGPLAEFKARYPELTLEAVFSDRQVDLLAEGFDLAIRAGDVADTQLITHRLATAEMFVCASKAYLERRGTPREPEELARHECLLYAYHAVPGTWTLQGPRGEISVRVEGTLVANHARMLMEAASQGLGLAFLPVFHTAPYLRDGRLRRVLPGWQRTVALQALFPHARHLSAKVRVLVDFLAERFRVLPWAGWDSK